MSASGFSAVERRAHCSSARAAVVARSTPAAPRSASAASLTSRRVAAVAPTAAAPTKPPKKKPPNPRRSPAACAMNAAAMSGNRCLLLSPSSERYVVLRTVAWVLVDATHRVAHQHGHLGSGLVARKRDARDGRSDRRAADVPRSSFVQSLSNDVIVTTLTGAKLWMLQAQLPVHLEHQLFQRVLHPAIGNGARSRL